MTAQHLINVEPLRCTALLMAGVADLGTRNLFSKLKDWSRIALRRDKTRRSWMGFAHLAAAVINLRVAEFSHRP